MSAAETPPGDQPEHGQPALRPLSAGRRPAAAGWWRPALARTAPGLVGTGGRLGPSRLGVAGRAERHVAGGGIAAAVPLGRAGLSGLVGPVPAARRPVGQPAGEGHRRRGGSDSDRRGRRHPRRPPDQAQPSDPGGRGVQAGDAGGRAVGRLPLRGYLEWRWIDRDVLRGRRAERRHPDGQPDDRLRQGAVTPPTRISRRVSPSAPRCPGVSSRPPRPNRSRDPAERPSPGSRAPSPIRAARATSTSRRAPTFRSPSWPRPATAATRRP